MTVYEILSIVIAAIALFVSLYSRWRVKKTSSATIELMIHSTITSTKERVSDIGIRVAEIEKDPDKRREAIRHAFLAALENNLNAYEEACAKYLDDKVDKARFRKMYQKEIRQLVNDPAYKDYFDSVKSPYKAILKVYKEWEDLEKRRGVLPPSQRRKGGRESLARFLRAEAPP